MSAAFAALLLTFVTVSWLALSLLPALRELATRTDVEPLQLTRGSGDIRHFAISFRRFVEAERAAFAVQGAPSDADLDGEYGMPVQLRDGAHAWYIRPAATPDAPSVLPVAVGDIADRVIISERSVLVPTDTVLLKELFVDGSLRGRDGAFYRAVLCTGSATLGVGSSVLRWIDTGGDLTVGQGAVLHGRASSYGTMTLGKDVRFQRIAAPCIRVAGIQAARRAHLSLEAGEPALAWDALAPAERVRTNASRDTISLEMLLPPENAKVSFGRWIIDGDFEVPRGATVDCDLIVSGTLIVGDGAVVRGAVKSAVIRGDGRAIYHGAIVATSRLVLGAGSIVVGPVVVEGEAVIGEGCRVGGVGDETTISAVSVRMGAGTEVHGEVWTRSWGETS